VLSLPSLDESQQIGTVQGEPAATSRSCPQTNVQRCVGNVIVSPLRVGQGISTSTVVVKPLPGGHDPLLDGSLLDGSLLDDSLLDGSLLEGSLLEEDSLLEDEELEDDEDDSEDEELLDEELDEEDDELGFSQQPSPNWTTSHLRLSAIHLAQPNVPAGTESANSQHSPLGDPGSWQMSGQTTPIES